MSSTSKSKNVYLGPMVMRYVVDGDPIPLQRARHGLGRTYDSQKQVKYSVGLQLKTQHEAQPLFEGPLRLDVTFYMPITNRMSSKFREHCPRMPHTKKPDLDNLVKFILDVGNKIIYHDDSIVATINAQKTYSVVPRTEMTITRIENEAAEVI